MIRDITDIIFPFLNAIQKCIQYYSNKKTLTDDRLVIELLKCNIIKNVVAHILVQSICTCMRTHS